MEFYTAFSEKRPIRLCEKTRQFAMESLNARYGDDATKVMHVEMDTVPDFAEMSDQEKYNAMIMKIVKEAPIRICENECVAGAATLGDAIYHKVPATFGGNTVFYSVSHLTIDFETVIFRGVDFLEEKIRSRLSDPLTADQREQLEGMANVICAMHIWHDRYLSALKDTRPDICKNLKNVPFRPATSFREAVQSLWFTFSFVRLCGNWPGIGRIDEMLGGFLEKDLERGAITIDEAREFLAGMFIKGCEWIKTEPAFISGDAQHYQNIILGGIDKNGNEVTNAVTYLVLDIVEELAISDFPISVRVNEHTPDKLLTKVAQVMRHGGGTVAIYNEPLIIRSLVDFGYDEKEARCFANDGCWEVQIPGKTDFGYYPFDSLQVLLNDTLNLNTDTPAEFSSFENLYSAYIANIQTAVGHIFEDVVRRYTDKEPGEKWEWGSFTPCSVVSLFEKGCIENGRPYSCGGPEYVVASPHIGGAPDAGNSLFAIDKLVFKEKKISFSELMHALKNNWENYEVLRRYALNKLVYYGNDNDEADSYTVRILNDFAKAVSAYHGVSPILFPAGVSTFGRQIEWANQRGAVPFGKKQGDILSGNASPTPDTDFEGATAVIRSYCKTDLSLQTCGAALDVKLYPTTVEGENGLLALKSLIGGFLELGGFFMQLDVVDAKVLIEAQKNPDQYRTLSVRVSGWNARFVSLDSKWQQMIIERTSQNI